MFLTVSPYLLILLLFLLLVMVISVKKRKLTLDASFTAAMIGLIVLHSAHLKGVAMLMTFFVLSLFATAHKRTIKKKLHPDNRADKGRNSGQVLANGGIAGLTGLLSSIDPQHRELYLIMMAASIASALADTLSSELGMVYGRRYFNILSLKKDANGLDGVVSIEGLLIGAAGSGIIAFIFSGFNQVSLIVFAAGIVGNLSDSILGAALERKRWIGNNAVNFLNTLIAALFALLIMN